MKTILIIVAVLATIAAAIYFLTKKGWIADRDGDNIPDVVEDKVDDIKANVKAKAKKVKATTKARAAVVKEELGDVADAILGIPVIEGKVTKTKLREFTKVQLLAIADKKFDTDLGAESTKTNLVNKVYALYYPNKK
jgi:ABC-type transporter MlaC component|tara:strand:+ start:56 stop:466 length:411 start_codon:yes stop_codon:yes gene_type:complete